jgi:glucose-6-phosphate isomerase
VDPSTLPAWNTLLELAAINDQTTIAQLFRADASRGDSLSLDLSVAGTEMLVDFSRQNVSNQVLAALLDLARETDLEGRRELLVSGAVVNQSEGRAALHLAERSGASNEDATKFAEAVRAGAIKGVGGRFTHVVNVGIGGSDLGPALVHDALREWGQPMLEARFISNVDDQSFQRQMSGLDPRTTLFIFCSKSFGTAETLSNAWRVHAWLTTGIEEAAVSRHCVVVSSAPQLADAAGVRADYRFVTPVEVGGRFSVSSSVNLVNEIAFGAAAIAQFRAGMAAIDEHFVSTPLARNAPVLMGLISVWNRTFLGRHSRALIAYLDALASLVPFIQQLEMESNGKRVLEDSSHAGFSTGPVVWGGVGTDAQHAFMQLIHQGTDVIPVDFVGVSQSAGRRNDELIANMEAQAQALAVGRSIDQVRRSGVEESLARHREMPGNRPSTSILLRELNPTSLGALIALYEHSTFVQGAVLGINSFDQWGVELGKEIAREVLEQIGGAGVAQPAETSKSSLVAWHLRQSN